MRHQPRLIVVAVTAILFGVGAVVPAHALEFRHYAKAVRGDAIGRCLTVTYKHGRPINAIFLSSSFVVFPDSQPTLGKRGFWWDRLGSGLVFKAKRTKARYSTAYGERGTSRTLPRVSQRRSHALCPGPI